MKKTTIFVVAVFAITAIAVIGCLIFQLSFASMIAIMKLIADVVDVYLSALYGIKGFKNPTLLEKEQWLFNVASKVLTFLYDLAMFNPN